MGFFASPRQADPRVAISITDRLGLNEQDCVIRWGQTKPEGFGLFTRT